MRLERSRLVQLALLVLVLMIGTAQGCDDDDPDPEPEGAAANDAPPPTEPGDTVPDNDDSDPKQRASVGADRSHRVGRHSSWSKVSSTGCWTDSIRTVEPLEEALILVLEDMPVDDSTVAELEEIRALESVNPQLVDVIDDTLARSAALGGG